MKVLSIDPGNRNSAWCMIDGETLKPLSFGKEENRVVLAAVQHLSYDSIVIERVASYGMAVGRDVFETCEWVGRFTQAARVPPDYVYRQEEKLHICGDSRAKDTNIRRALIDRFAQHDIKNGKGTKKNPDWFYGFSADVWQAYAVAVTYVETRCK